MQHKRVQKPHQLINGKAATLKELLSVSLFATVVRVFTENLPKLVKLLSRNTLQTTKVMQHKRVQKPHQLINGKAATLKNLLSRPH